MQITFNPINNNQNNYRLNNPLFKAKINDFEKGINRFVAKTYNERKIFDINNIKDENNLKRTCKGLVEKLRKRDFGGRSQNGIIMRKAMLKEWFDYVTANYDSAIVQILILMGITSQLKPDEDKLPPVLNRRALADTVKKVDDEAKNNEKAQINFYKEYNNNLNKLYFGNEKVMDESKTGWIIIPSKEHDPKNFEANVDKLKTLSNNSWCTKSYMAEPHLSKGDFHIYIEKGKPQLGVRFVNDEIAEIQGEKNNGKIPVKYYNQAKEHIKGYKYTDNTNKQLKQLEKVKKQVEKIKSQFPDGIENASREEIFDYFGIKYKKLDDGLLKISEYSSEVTKDISYDDLGIDENKLFKNIKAIKGNANFRYSQLTDLGKLESIGGKADFYHSQITSLGNLESIGGDANFLGSHITDLGNLKSIGEDANFRGSQITDLGNLKSIGGKADFCDSKVKDLGNLKSIGGKADFYHSQITSLGNLESIGGDANFNGSQIKDLGNLESIGGKAKFGGSQIKDLGNLKSIGGNAEFYDSKITDLGNLKTIGGKVISEKLKSAFKNNDLAKDFSTQEILEMLGIEYKKDKDDMYIIQNYYDDFVGIKYNRFGIDENKLFKDVKIIEGDANFNGSQITNLGNLKSIGGNADFRGSEITSLGNLESIGGNADFKWSEITSLGNLKSIGGDANFRGSHITDLGNLKSIGRYADFEYSQITDLGNLESIGGYANFRGSQIKDLGKLKSIGWGANFYRSQIKDLGNLESIRGDAFFECSRITSLGNLKSIGRDADFSGSRITSLGNLESIGGNADFKWSEITSLGNLKSIGGDADFRGSQITDLGNLKSIGGKAEFYNSKVKDLGNLKSIGGDANFGGSQITDLGNLKSIGRNADFKNSKIKDLGNLESIGGGADTDKITIYRQLKKIKCNKIITIDINKLYLSSVELYYKIKNIIS